MASDALREAIRSDPELLATANWLAALIAASEAPFRQALEAADLDHVADALAVDRAELAHLATLFYRRAVELAEEFPELGEQASRWRGQPL